MLRVTQLIGFGGQAAAPVVGTKTLSAGGASYSIAGTAAAVVPSVHGRLTAGGGSYGLVGTVAAIRKSLPPPLDGLSPTAAWSASRKLLTAYGGAFYALTSSAVDTLYDQSGSARNLTQSNSVLRPTIVSAGPNSIPGAQFDGVNDRLTSAGNMSVFISVSAGYMIATIRPTSFPIDSVSYDNSIIIANQTLETCMTVGNNGGSPLYYAYNYDGGDHEVHASVAVNTVYVVEWRHEGGVLYQRLNGAGETSTSSGNTPTFVNPFNLGGRTSGNSFAGQIFEAVTFSTVPTLAQRDALVQALGLWVGASV